MNTLNKKFGLTVGGIFLAIFLYQLVFKHRELIYVGAIGGVLVLAALAVPQVLNPLRIVWDKIGWALGIINTYVILFIVFFLLVTPLGFILRLMKKNLVSVKWKKGNKSYWQQATILEKDSYKQQF